MKTTLKEVISIPAGESIRFIEPTNVHACPNEFPWSSYQPATYMTFRYPYGIMKRLYSVLWKGVLNPYEPAELSQVPAEYRSQVADYIRLRHAGWSFDSDSFTFYVLNPEIELEHHPRLEYSIRGHCYFWTAD